MEIRGLPSSIDTQAIRVSGLGTARLFDVVCTVGTNNAASYAVESSSEVIRILKVKKSLLETEKRVLDHEAELLVSYGKTLTGEHVNTTQMSQFLEMFVTQGQKNLKAVIILCSLCALCAMTSNLIQLFRSMLSVKQLYKLIAKSKQKNIRLPRREDKHEVKLLS